MEDLRQGYGGERGLQTKAGSEVRKWRADQLDTKTEMKLLGVEEGWIGPWPRRACG